MRHRRTVGLRELPEPLPGSGVSSRLILRRFAHVVLVFSLLLAPSRGSAQDDEEEPTALWDESWGRSGIPNYTLIGATVAMTVVDLILRSNTGRGNRDRNDFDEAVRSALRLPDQEQRLLVRDFSDGLLTLMTSAPLFDALILAAWQHESEDTALQMILIHAEVIAVTLAFQTLANVLLVRERPYGRTCGEGGPDDLPEDSFYCDSSDRYSGFFSGHTSQAFASAAVLCSFHMNIPLMGSGPENTLVPCILGFVAASTTGLFRVLSDMHYASDVITGAAVGTSIGFLVPWLLHFNPRSQSADDDDVQVTFVPTPTGIAVAGIF